jgi:hypothetical protein
MNEDTRLPGVAFNDPPAHLFDAIRAKAIAVTGELGPGDRGAIVTIPTKAGINAAAVAKLGNHWFVTGFIGKQWDEPLDVGGAVKFKW